MKFLTVLEYLVDEIKSNLDIIQSIVNHPKDSPGKVKYTKEIIESIRDKLDIMCE